MYTWILHGGLRSVNAYFLHVHNRFSQFSYYGRSPTSWTRSLFIPMEKETQAQTLTNRQGHPISDNQNIRTVGNRGPSTLENYHFLEKISHFDRERIPERVVHARGAGAHGYFEAYGKVGDEPVSKYTRAKLFQAAGKRTPVFVRFSAMARIPNWISTRSIPPSCGITSGFPSCL